MPSRQCLVGTQLPSSRSAAGSLDVSTTPGGLMRSQQSEESDPPKRAWNDLLLATCSILAEYNNTVIYMKQVGYVCVGMFVAPITCSMARQMYVICYESQAIVYYDTSISSPRPLPVTTIDPGQILIYYHCSYS